MLIGMFEKIERECQEVGEKFLAIKNGYIDGGLSDEFLRHPKIVSYLEILEFFKTHELIGVD